jgi:nitroreductase
METTPHALIADRWSPRAFDAEHRIGDADLAALFEAARWAPSSMNEQPWRYRFARRGDPGFDALYDALMPGNQAWAGNASLLVACFVEPAFRRNGKPNRHAWHDAGAANLSLALEAGNRGLHAHAMGGFDRDRAMALPGVDPDWEAVCFLAVGRRTSADTLPETLRERETAERTRLPLEEVARPLA